LFYPGLRSCIETGETHPKRRAARPRRNGFTEDASGNFDSDTLGRFQLKLLGSVSAVFKEDELDFDLEDKGSHLRFHGQGRQEQPMRHVTYATAILFTLALRIAYAEQMPFDSLLAAHTHEIIQD